MSGTEIRATQMEFLLCTVTFITLNIYVFIYILMRLHSLFLELFTIKRNFWKINTVKSIKVGPVYYGHLP